MPSLRWMDNPIHIVFLGCDALIAPFDPPHCHDGSPVAIPGLQNKTAPLAHKRSRETVILFAEEEHRRSDQILSGVVGKVVQEQPNAAVKPATEIGIAENRVRNGKERCTDRH